MSNLNPEKAGRFCITDVGSTTTKALLFQKNGSDWEFFRDEASTTVEKPHEDVCVGVMNALEALQKKTGVKLISDSKPAVPYLSTSSAGGGLAMVVTGLVRDVSSKSAKTVALGAGAILLDVIAMDDGRTPYEKIQALKSLRPDMILLAGGFDGDAVSGPVFLSELIRESGLKPKLNPTAKLPVVYAGNTNAREYAAQTLGDDFLFYPVPNIRPSDDSENLEPAREAIHDLFNDHVMFHAPGYPQLISWADAPIVPTPSAFGKILALASGEMGARILAIDIGGATTDVFTAENGSVTRTVSANLGMSYSILNVARRGGIHSIQQVLGAGTPEDDLWNAIGNKYIRPTNLPNSRDGVRFEWATAALAIREAVRDHQRVLSGISISRNGDELKIKRDLFTGGKKERASKNEGPLITGYDLVIGSGGILSHSPRDAAAMMLINALQPKEPVTLAVDRAFMFPHLGVLSETDADLAFRLFQKLGLLQLGTYFPADISTHGNPENFRLKGRTSHGQSIDYSFRSGDVISYSLGHNESAVVELASDKKTLMKWHSEYTGGECGLIIDTRQIHSGPGERTNRTAPPGVLLLEEREIKPPVTRRGHQSPRRIIRGTIRLDRELAIPGTVFVNKGSNVQSETVIARSQRQFLRPFFLNVGTGIKSSPDDIERHLLKRIGDTIESDEIIASHRLNRFNTKKYRSPVSGTLERILPSGILVVREHPEDAKQLGTATVARDLRIRPEQIKPYLKVTEGQLVEKGQSVATMLRPGDMRYSRSPIRGKVSEINHRYGVVQIEPLLEELAIQAWMPGRISKTTTRGAVVENNGVRIEGIWGIGGEVSGPIATGEIRPGSIMIRQNIDAEEFEKLVHAQCTGLITGSASFSAVGNSEFPLTIILTEGFGDTPMNSDVWDICTTRENRLCLLDGTTELRVGVRRPVIIIPDE